MTRREFLWLGAGAVTVIGFSAKSTAEDGTPGVDEIPVIWIAAGSCSGCSVALLNSDSPSISELLLDEVLPGKHISLAFHQTVMAGQGEQAIKVIHDTAEKYPGGFVLVVDGAISVAEDGLYCGVGEYEGHHITGEALVRELGEKALAVLAVGACASFGGIPAAGPNPTGCISVPELFKRESISTPVVRIPGCPPHPDWIVGSIAALLIGGLEGLELDELSRPGAFFGGCIHDNCQYRGHFERGEFAEKYGDHGCLIKLGCKGPITHADCPIRKFNNGSNWCVEAGHPCIGCCHPDFPFEQSMFEPVQPVQLSYPEKYPEPQDGTENNMPSGAYATVGAVGATAFVAGAGVAAAAKKLARQDAEDAESEEAADGS